MPDKGHMETEALLRALEKRIAAEYRKANREITRKVNAYMSEFKRKDKEWREKLENGDITEAEYKAWQTGQVMIGKRWEEMRHTLAQDYANTNDLAKQMAFDSMPDVYALNHNYATFEAEKGGKVDTSYTLYDRPTVERLIRDDPKLLPDPRPGSPLAQKLAKHKELRWEEQHVQSVVLQSILQGESLEQTAKRFSQLTEMNYRQSVRYARTATTGAQNAGRVDGYKRAEKLGVNMKQVWFATLDSRTRHEHRVLDGQEVDVGEPFIMDGFKIKYPGDPAAPAHLLFNCRCTVIAKVKGVDFNVSDKTQRDDKIGDMSYEEWKGEHKTAPKPPENVPEGKAVEVKVDKPAKGEYKEESIKPKQEEKQKLDELLKNANDTREVSQIATDYFKAKGSKIENVNLGKCELNAAKAICIKADELDSKFESTLRSIECHSMPAEYGGQSVPDENAFNRWLKSPDLDRELLITRMHLNELGLKSENAIKNEFNLDMRSLYGKVALNPWVDEKNANLSTFVHEYGHSIILGKANEVALSQGRINRDYMPFKRLYNTYMKELRDIEKEMQKIRDSYAGQPDGLAKGNKAVQKLQEKYDSICISHYSKDSPGEFIAEALCDYELSSKPREASTKVYETLVKLFGKE